MTASPLPTPGPGGAGAPPPGSGWAGAPAPGSALVARMLPVLAAAAGLYAAVVSLIAILQARNTDAWLLPLAAGVGCAVLGLCAAIERVVPITPLSVLGRSAVAMALLLAYAFVLLPILGFLPASVLLVLAVTAVFASRRVFVGAGGLIIAVGMWALFAYALSEPLPGGLW